MNRADAIKALIEGRKVRDNLGHPLHWHPERGAVTDVTGHPVNYMPARDGYTLESEWELWKRVYEQFFSGNLVPPEKCLSAEEITIAATVTQRVLERVVSWALNEDGTDLKELLGIIREFTGNGPR